MALNITPQLKVEPDSLQATLTTEKLDSHRSTNDVSKRLVSFLTKIYHLAARYSLYVSQFTAWVICSVLFRSLYKLDITGKEKITSVQSPLILVSNHINFYDGFIIRVALGAFPRQIMPLRFMAVIRFSQLFLNVMTWTGIIPFFYFIFGVFVIQQGKGIDKNLEKAKEVLAMMQTVVMYPEGEIVLTDTLGRFKKGAAALALQTGTPILPLSIRKISEKGKRTRMRINIGDLIHLSPTDSYEKGTEVLYNAVGSLHAQK